MAVCDPESEDRPDLAEQRAHRWVQPIGKEPPGFGPGGSAGLYTMGTVAQPRRSWHSTKASEIVYKQLL